MTGIKSTHLCTIFYSILIVLSVLIGDVNGRAYKSSSSSRRHTSHTSHSYPSHTSRTGHSYPTHTSRTSHYPTHTSRTSHPSRTGLSGDSGSGSVTQHKYSAVHSYPNAPSGGSSSQSYPSPPLHSLSGGSSSGGHSYPSSSSSSSSGNRPASASYPSSTGLSGNTASGTVRGSVSYPSSHGLSGNTASGTHDPSGVRVTGGSSYPHNSYPSTNVHHSTTWNSQPQVHVHHTNSPTIIHQHHHYAYRPPTVIHYSSSYGHNPISYPVYSGVPPPYVYEYRSSGNKYSYLLAGLALYNLGRISSNSNSHYYHKHYVPQPDERCKFGVQYGSGRYEEMAIDCRAITYFIFEEQPQLNIQTQAHVTTNVINQTSVTTQIMYPNGTLVVSPNSQTQVLAGNGAVIPNTQTLLSGNGVVMPNTQQVNTVTTTTTQTVSVNDPKLAGSPVKVNPDMECYVSRATMFTNMRKPVPCGLLHEYAASSLRRNSAVRATSSVAIIMIAVSLILYH